jgi:hypothetical protein
VQQEWAVQQELAVQQESAARREREARRVRRARNVQLARVRRIRRTLKAITVLSRDRQVDPAPEAERVAYRREMQEERLVVVA